MKNTVQHFWDKLYESGRDYRYIASDELSEILNRTGVKNGKVLDIGCGTGQLSREIYHRGFTVLGADISANAVKIAQSLSKYVDYIHIDFENDPIKNLGSNYDLVTCKLVYAFIKDRPQFIKRVKQVLSKKGFFVIITPALEQVELAKKDIAIDFKETAALLNKHFKEVAHYESNGLTIFICN